MILKGELYLEFEMNLNHSSFYRFLSSHNALLKSLKIETQGGTFLGFFLINNQIRQIFFKVEVTYLFTNILCFCFNLFPVKIYFRLSRFPQTISRQAKCRSSPSFQSSYFCSQVSSSPLQQNTYSACPNHISRGIHRSSSPILCFIPFPSSGRHSLGTQRQLLKQKVGRLNPHLSFHFYKFKPPCSALQKSCVVPSFQSTSPLSVNEISRHQQTTQISSLL